MAKKSKDTSAKTVSKNTKERKPPPKNYWYTMIILVKEDHKERLAKISKTMRMSRTKIIGKLIEGFINKHERN